MATIDWSKHPYMMSSQHNKTWLLTMLKYFTHSNLLQIAQAKHVWVDIMFTWCSLYFGLQMNELDGIDVGLKSSINHEKVAWGVKG